MNRYQRNKAITRQWMERMEERRAFITERAMERLNSEAVDRWVEMKTDPAYVAEVVNMRVNATKAGIQWQ